MKIYDYLNVLMVILIAICVSFTSGCAIKQPGSRTFTFGADGATITSETIAASSADQVEIEKEKTRQICYKQESKNKAKVESAIESNPLVAVLYEQSKTINNAMSLLKTGKNYDPCPGSTNSSDVEIADSQMYSNIYTSAIGLGKFVAGAWMATEISGDLFGALGKAGGYSLIASGNESSIQITDSFKSSVFRDGATTGDLFSNPSVVTENILPGIE